tara:strand:+ start:9266 stop:9547 length:282 start_codon:yes stop_codon:yes gene_type:complete
LNGLIHLEYLNGYKRWYDVILVGCHNHFSMGVKYIMRSSLYNVMDKKEEDTVCKKEGVVKKPVLIGRWNWYIDEEEEEERCKPQPQRYNWWIE